MKLRNKFKDEDLNRIRAAVKEAEDAISGEIVPVIVERSGDYDQARYKSSLVFGAVSFVVMILLDRYVIDPSHTLYYDPMFIFFVVTIFSLLGYFLPDFSTPLKRFFLSQAVMDECTRQKAEACFLEEEVFNTKQRTGIMIFISFFEHEVIIIADKGISKVVEQKEWDAMVANLISFIRQDKVVEGLEAGIKRCGAILLEKGFHKAADDINELGDELRIS
ncbi:MAG TPA: TPM domain-containing protein [Chryseosolibacter sp.]|nr:TPM domain-containing protein [Chryseosolibacter sp.]